MVDTVQPSSTRRGLPNGAADRQRRKRLVDLPEHVVSCSAVRGRSRFGVKLRFPLRGGGQIRVGSTYANVESAEAAVQFFQAAAHFNPVTKAITVDESKVVAFAAVTVNVFQERGVEAHTISVSEYVRDILQRRMARPKRVKRKERKNSASKAKAASSAASGAAPPEKRRRSQEVTVSRGLPRGVQPPPPLPQPKPQTAPRMPSLRLNGSLASAYPTSIAGMQVPMTTQWTAAQQQQVYVQQAHVGLNNSNATAAVSLLPQIPLHRFNQPQPQAQLQSQQQQQQQQQQPRAAVYPLTHSGARRRQQVTSPLRVPSPAADNFSTIHCAQVPREEGSDNGYDTEGEGKLVPRIIVDVETFIDPVPALPSSPFQLRPMTSRRCAPDIVAGGGAFQVPEWVVPTHPPLMPLNAPPSSALGGMGGNAMSGIPGLPPPLLNAISPHQITLDMAALRKHATAGSHSTSSEYSLFRAFGRFHPGQTSFYLVVSTEEVPGAVRSTLPHSAPGVAGSGGGGDGARGQSVTRCAKLRTWHRHRTDQMLFEVDVMAAHKSFSVGLSHLYDPPLSPTDDVTVVFRVFASDDLCRTTTKHQLLSVTGPVWCDPPPPASAAASAGASAAASASAGAPAAEYAAGSGDGAREDG